MRTLTNVDCSMTRPDGAPAWRFNYDLHRAEWWNVCEGEWQPYGSPEPHHSLEYHMEWGVNVLYWDSWTEPVAA